MAIYAIGSRVLRKLGSSKVAPLAWHAYYLGASSSPKRILVTRTTLERFWYKVFPYQDNEIAIERDIGCDLIEQGTRTRLAGIEALGDPSDERLELLRGVLVGGPGTPDEPERWIPMTATVRLRPGRDAAADFAHERAHDPWYALERYGSVGGQTVDGEPQWRVDGYAHELMDLSGDLRFEVLALGRRES